MRTRTDDDASTGPASQDAFVEFPRTEIEQSIGRRFEQVAAKYPDRLAIWDPDHALTFSELNEWANRVAHRILDLRGDAPAPVALLMDTGAPIVACILGLLKVGMIYGVVDPQHPAERIRFMLDDMQTRTVVVRGTGPPRLAEMVSGSALIVDFDDILRDVPAPNPTIEVGPDTRASLVYTSGSTGRPKGVLDTHRNILHEAWQRTNVLRISPADRMAVFDSFSFSAAFRSAFPALLTGASSHVWPMLKRGTAGLAQWLTQQHITILSATGVVRRWVAEVEGRGPLATVRAVYLGSETVYRRDVERCRQAFRPDVIMIS
jgi:non-ribosomal peptide synthetase component F